MKFKKNKNEKNFSKENDLEVNEYSLKTRKIGREMVNTIKLDLHQIEEAQTARILEDKTQRIGKSKESSIVSDFWDYYLQFSSDNLPDPENYYGEDTAELKISVLINLFEDLYRESKYPSSFPVPIIQESFIRNEKPAKVFVVGDTHGCFIDTVKLIPYFTTEIERGKINGYEVRVIFIGDVVDRGVHDIHNLLYVMMFNLKYPKSVLYLRGNHEEISICAHYGFGQRVIETFSQMTFASFTNMFKSLPLISHYHCSGGSVMCLHGGIPIIIDENDKEKYTIPQLNIHKFHNREVFLEDMDEVTQQILWNDPILNYDPTFHEKFFPNKRGVGYVFGSEIFNDFCKINRVNLLFRGHQVFRDGYHKTFDGKFITLFSASDYVNMKIKSRFAEFTTDDIYNVQILNIQDLPG